MTRVSLVTCLTPDAYTSCAVAGDDDNGGGMTKKLDEKVDGVIIIDAVGTILMVNKVGAL